MVVLSLLHAMGTSCAHLRNLEASVLMLEAACFLLMLWQEMTWICRLRNGLTGLLQSNSSTQQTPAKSVPKIPGVAVGALQGVPVGTAQGSHIAPTGQCQCVFIELP